MLSNLKKTRNSRQHLGFPCVYLTRTRPMPSASPRARASYTRARVRIYTRTRVARAYIYAYNALARYTYERSEYRAKRSFALFGEAEPSAKPSALLRRRRTFRAPHHPKKRSDHSRCALPSAMRHYMYAAKQRWPSASCFAASRLYERTGKARTPGRKEEEGPLGPTVHRGDYERSE